MGLRMQSGIGARSRLAKRADGGCKGVVLGQAGGGLAADRHLKECGLGFFLKKLE